MRPTVLTVAGSDPSGGAGLQGDLKAIEANGGYAATVVTAITAQNTLGVLDSFALSADQLRAQLEAVFSDLDVRAVKSGMLGSLPAIQELVRALDLYRPQYYVLDPLLSSTSGFPLLPEGGVELLLRELVPRATIVTPNAPELERLTGIRVRDVGQAEGAARRLLALGARAVLVKGGHLDSERVVDVLVTPSGARQFDGPRVAGHGAHGSGCVHSAALATRLAAGDSLDEAVRRAREFMTTAIRHAVSPGRGRPSTDPAAAPSDPSGIHVLTDQSVQSRFSHAELARLAVLGGAHVIQFREKAPWPTARLVEQAQEIAALVRSRGVRLVINDRADVALAVGASGVHLGRQDLDPLAARRMLGPQAMIGATANDRAEARALVGAPVDYLGVGPVFGTSSKAGAAVPALGLEEFGRIAREVAPRPVVAIGNITPERVHDLVRAGARGIAVLSAVACRENPAEEVARFREAFERAAGRVRSCV